jgi:hypothetical protein
LLWPWVLLLPLVVTTILKAPSFSYSEKIWAVH